MFIYAKILTERFLGVDLAAEGQRSNAAFPSVYTRRHYNEARLPSSFLGVRLNGIQRVMRKQSRC